jgi:hypothetical protein
LPARKTLGNNLTQRVVLFTMICPELVLAR